MKEVQHYALGLLKEQPWQAFKIYPGISRRGRYYVVAIYDTLDKLRRAAMNVTYLVRDTRYGARVRKGEFRNAAGVTHAMDISSNYRMMPVCGFILLHRAHLDAGYVTHECCHAALYYIARRENRRRFGDPYEDRQLDERLAWITGQLVSDFWAQWFKNNPNTRLTWTTGKDAE